MKKLIIGICAIVLIGVFCILASNSNMQEDKDVELGDINSKDSLADSCEEKIEGNNEPSLENVLDFNEKVNNGQANNSTQQSSTNKRYSIGDEVQLGNIEFNVYKVYTDKKELYLLAKKNIATTRFSPEDRSYKEENNYEGSLVEDYVNKFVDDLEDMGYIIKSSGIMDKDDLYNLGFKDSVTVSGRPYIFNNVPEFVKYEKNYWLGGYYRVDTYAWAYYDQKIDTKNCEEKYGVRPIIVIEQSEVDKQPKTIEKGLTISEIVSSDCVWKSEGGISNPYDRFYFDCTNGKLIYEFESAKLSKKCEYTMKIIDEKTIQVSGVKTYSEFPAEITIVDANKLRIRFFDDEHNNGDYFLNKVCEANVK